MDEKKWTYQQISRYNKDDLYALLLQAWPVYSDSEYLNAARQIHPGGGNLLTELSWGL
jgi:hypothetical protein